MDPVTKSHVSDGQDIGQSYQRDIKIVPSQIPAEILDDAREIADAPLTEILSESLKKVQVNWVSKSPQEIHIALRIIRLLIRTTKILQDFGIAQAQHMTLLTDMQNAYTELQGKVKTGTTAGIEDMKDEKGKPLSKEKKEELIRVVGEQNQAASLEIDKLRSLRDIIQNEAKQLSTALNTTNDATNQWMDYLFKLIEEMAQLNSYIFR